MSRHDELYKAAMDAIKELFSDNSVPLEETANSLETLIDEIHDLLATLED